MRIEGTPEEFAAFGRLLRESAESIETALEALGAIQKDEGSRVSAPQGGKKTRLSDYGKRIKHRLIDLEKTNTWLCDEVAQRTGKYFDDSILSRICRGQSSPALDEASAVICEILNLEEQE